MTEDESAQENELLALESIFDNEGIISHHEKEKDGVKFKAGVLKISPDVLSPPFNITCNYIKKSSTPVDETAGELVTSKYITSYLPPICLNFIFPKNYPSSSAPEFTLSCVWLQRIQLSDIAKKLDSLWNEQEGQEVLYTWTQFLKEDVLSFLQLDDGLQLDQQKYIDVQQQTGLDNRVMQSVSRFSDILPYIRNYDEGKCKKVFDNTPFPCNICFTERFGRNCIQFKVCEHVFCEDCIKSFFDIHIKEGNMKALTCPDPGCDSQAFPVQIKNLVSKEDYERYETLLLQTTLDTMKDVTYCPRRFCQSAVVIEPDETMGLCTVCMYSFCTFCKLAYHGVEPCKLKQEKLRSVCDQYENGDQTTRKQLELIYGATALRDTINEIESERWLAKNSKNCPGCGAAVEKKDGCNKMTCSKCKCYFCWLCMQRLHMSNPYSHYNTFNSKCYNKLFQGVVIDNEFPDDEDLFF